MELHNYHENIGHLNIALRAVRAVNRLLVREKDGDELLKGICDILIKNRNYNKVWLFLLDDSGSVDKFAQANTGDDFSSISDFVKQGEMSDCACKALQEKKSIFIKKPSSFCSACPLTKKYLGWGVITIPLVYEEKIYGLLSVSIPKEIIGDEIEQAFVEEIAEDIAFGLYRIKREENHKKAEATLTKRVKELNYIFTFSEFVEKKDASLEKIIQSAVDLIPSAMQFSEIACAQIIFGNQNFKTDNFTELSLKLSRDIIDCGEKVGVLEAGYLEEKPGGELEPFLEEEKQLISSIALRVGKIIERKQGRYALEKSEKRFRDLVENSLTCISIIHDEKIVYQSPEHIRQFGLATDLFTQDHYDNIHPDDVFVLQTALKKITSGQLGNVDIEFRFYSPEKNEIRKEMKWVHCRLSRLEHKGKDSTLINLMDITHAKELEHLMRIQDKMTSLGRVTAGIAHEIRNPLSGINIYLKAMEKLCTKNENQEKVAKILFQLQSASNKIESVIKRVMDFSKPGEPSFMMIDLNKPVEEAINLSLMTLTKSGINVNFSLGSNLPKCNADPHMIEQVVLNLITNASEALKNNKTKKNIMIFTLTENDYVCIKVCDSGPGVPEHLMYTIFDPFYTTKKHSSGIGLSISHRIISDHGGILDVVASDTGGAEFIVKIPVKITEK